jgi:N-acetylglutamate synthase/N-acetylornithine aminotransferase
MATMLGLHGDAQVSQAVRWNHSGQSQSADQSFHSRSIDGVTSTND